MMAATLQMRRIEAGMIVIVIVIVMVIVIVIVIVGVAPIMTVGVLLRVFVSGVPGVR